MRWLIMLRPRVGSGDTVRVVRKGPVRRMGSPEISEDW